MIVDASDVRREREVAWRKERNPDIYVTSTNIGIYRSVSDFVLGRYSTTFAREAERVVCIITDNGKRLRGNLLERQWQIDPEYTTVVAEPTTHESPVFDTVEDVKWMRTSLELSMADLASLFGVTRKAVYDWLSEAQTQKAPYIRAVRSLIESQLPRESQPYLRQFWASSPNNAESLFEIIKSSDPTRFQESASTALAALVGPISNYMTQLTSKNQNNITDHVHNDDIYRSL